MSDTSAWGNDNSTAGNGDTPTTTSAVANPSVTVIGVLKTGKVVKPDWTEKGVTHVMSERGLNALKELGIAVTDDESQYLF